MVSGTIYKISLTTESLTVLNGTTNLTLNNGNYASLGSNQWDWYNSELYVNIGSDPTGGNIEAGQRSYGIWLNGKNYITVENIIIRNVNISGLLLNNGSTGVIVNNVEGYSNGNETFKQLDTTSATYNNIIGSYNLDDGFSLHDSAIATINTGTFNNNVSGINNQNSSQITLNDVTISNNSQDGVWVLGATGGSGGITTINNATFTSNPNNLKIQNDQAINATNVTISGGTFGLYLNSTGQLTFSGVQISGVSNYAVYVFGSTTATISKANINNNNTSHIIDVESNGSLTLNNSLVHNNRGASKYSFIARSGSNNTIKNTVFYNNTHGLYVDTTGIIALYNSVLTSLGYGIAFYSGAPATNVTLSNNDFYSNTTNFYGASPTNTNGLAIDPSFTNPGGSDFTLQYISGLINTGIDVGLTTDYASNSVPQGSAPDIGAYEFQTGTVSSLAQYKSDGTTSVVTGNWTNETTMVLKFLMSSTSSSDSLTDAGNIRPFKGGEECVARNKQR